MEVDTLRPGLFISGRFRLKQLLGRGGMGSVWAAHHLTLEKDVAIKFLEPKWSGSEDARWRFAQEAIAVARMKSAHVVSVLDYGFTEENRAFIVMELLHGEDLGQRLARASKLGLDETREIVAQTCRGLEKSHSLGVVHRDLKPENLFLADEDGMVLKLLDFGVAKAVGMSAGGHITDTGQIVGTPLYMSPEQALGRLVDTRSDLYSLAVIAYRCLAGRLPFVDKLAGELLVALSTLTPPAPSGFVEGLPESLDRWFASMFRKDPDARCAQTAPELSVTFAAACSGLFEDPHTEPDPTALAKATAPTLIARSQIELYPRSAHRVELQSSASSEARPRMRRLAPLALLALIVSVLVWHHWPSTQNISSVPLSSITESNRPPPVEVRREVVLTVRVTPLAAILYLDGAPLGTNPFSGGRTADERPHLLRVEAPGYLPLEREIRLERDLHVELVMSPLPPLPAPAAAAASTALARTPRRHPNDSALAAKTKPPPSPASPPPSTPGTSVGEQPKLRPLKLDRTPPWRAP